MIQYVLLYKVDGTPFNRSGHSLEQLRGTGSQMITVKVLEGNPRVQLVPNTSNNPAATLQRGVQE